MSKQKKVLTVILDGLGLNPLAKGNAFKQAKTPTLNLFLNNYPYAVLEASGMAVGLPWGEVGNSEVGHTNLGSGQVLFQNLPRISLAIEDKSFYKNETLLKAFSEAKKRNSNIHLVGLCSNGGVHSHVEHLHALLYLAKQEKTKNIFVHAITDGRDTSSNIGINFIETLQEIMKTTKIGRLASVIGRFYAMDRNNNWDRIQKAYDLFTSGKGKKTQDIIKTIKESYGNKLNDENLLPISIVDKNENSIATINDNDIVICFNFRADRTRQITKSFVTENFNEFEQESKPKNLYFVTMMQYEKDLPVEIVFQPQKVDVTVGELISKHNKAQLRISETEKYAHVTYFFNGGIETPFPNETRMLIPSPDVVNYDEVPEMSASEVTKKIIKEIKKDKHDFILVNYANADMVGHTGNLNAGIKSIEYLDSCLKKLYELFVLEQNNIILITADHGNCEIMIDPISGKSNKEHTTNPVPFYVIDKDKKREKSEEEILLLKSSLTPIGILADVGPTILDLMSIPKSIKMTGRSLVDDCI